MIPAAKVAMAICLRVLGPEPADKDMAMCLEVVTGAVEACRDAWGPNFVPHRMKETDYGWEVECVPVSTEQASKQI